MQVLGLSKPGSDPVGRVALGKRSNILSLRSLIFSSLCFLNLKAGGFHELTHVNVFPGYGTLCALEKMSFVTNKVWEEG